MLASTVRARRKALGFGVEQAAGRMDLEARQLRRIEKGEANLTFDSLLRLAAGLDIRASDLLRNVESALAAAAPPPVEVRARGRVVPVYRAPPSSNENERQAIHERVGAEVARRRTLLRRTQRELAELAGISLSAVQSVERARHAPTTLTLEALATALRCHVSDLLPRGRKNRGDGS